MVQFITCDRFRKSEFHPAQWSAVIHDAESHRQIDFCEPHLREWLSELAVEDLAETMWVQINRIQGQPPVS